VSHRSPESLSQAQHCDRNKVRYLTAGLCHTCSAQAAWGHQLGFSQIKDPCSQCREVVAALPAPATGPWRKLDRRGLSALLIAQPAPGRSAHPATPTCSLTDERGAA
jgi:hypothetical protein